MERVSIIRCEGYGIAQVRSAVGRAVDALGGMAAFVKPGDRVLLKPNLLMRRHPDRATTTHPAVVQALAEMVAAAGGKPVVFDSPGGHLYQNRSTLESVYDGCGVKQAARDGGAELCYDCDAVDAPHPEGRLVKSVKTLRSVLEADSIINIPKLKTHMMMTFSGAVKNLFGIVPGAFKAEYHFRFEDEDDFAAAIVDICRFARPTLSVMDAVVGMEGFGPTNGTPRNIGLILASADPFALDVAAAAVVGLAPEKVPTIRESARRGLSAMRPEDVDIAGEPLEAVKIADFATPRNRVASNIYNWMLPRPAARWLNRAMKFKPAFLPGVCRGCGVCAKSCPAAAIEMREGKPVLTASKCIGCYCCHELCHFNAVVIRKPFPFKVLIR